jgi:site-specific DNA-adenine methylase
MEVCFGREGSPVIYIDPPYWTHQASNNNNKIGRKFTEEERKDMIQQIKFTLSSLKPDELSVNNFGTVRAWWD